MFYKSISAQVSGLLVNLVTIEVDISEGLPGVFMVGHLSSEIKEGSEKIRTVLKNIGYRLPTKRIVINLSPGQIIKHGTHYELPICMAFLCALGVIDNLESNSTLLVGELSLSGDVLSVPGILPIIMEGKKKGIKNFIVPFLNLEEAKLINGINIIPVKTVNDLINYYNDRTAYNKENFSCNNSIDKKNLSVDFSDIKGNLELKRAGIVAVCGMHNMLLVGPPGAGKSMFARRIPTIQPNLTYEETLNISKIYSIKGMLSNKMPLISDRPFRAPHHSITKTALIGGGNYPMPGEISLSEGGVLFLDELPEFPRGIIELLRQPLEEKEITITRNQGVVTYPAHFQLIAAMNPCPCGYYPDLDRCTCSSNQIKKYLGKLSGPFLDRIDICVQVEQTSYEDLLNKHSTEELSSSKMKEIVYRAIDFQKERYKNTDIIFNSSLLPKDIEKYCNLDNDCKNLISKAYESLNLTARSYHKVLKVARTIADIDLCDNIKIEHLSEALSYRGLDIFK